MRASSARLVQHFSALDRTRLLSVSLFTRIRIRARCHLLEIYMNLYCMRGAEKGYSVRATSRRVALTCNAPSRPVRYAEELMLTKQKKIRRKKSNGSSSLLVLTGCYQCLHYLLFGFCLCPGVYKFRLKKQYKKIIFYRI